MKKTTLLLVAILVSVALSVTGCGGGGGSDDVAIVDPGDTGGTGGDTGGTGGDTGGTGGDTGGTGGDTGGTGGDTGGTGGDTGGTGGDTGGTGGDTGGTGGDTGGTGGDTGGTGGTGGGTGGGDDEPTVADTDFNPVELAGLGGNFSAGVAINIDGLAVGLSDDGSSVKGAKWQVTEASPAAVIELSPLDGNNYSAAYGVNDPGVAVGESGAIVGVELDAIADANTVAVYWPIGVTVPSALSTEGLFAGGASAAFAINENGEIVGEAVNDDFGNTVGIYWASTSADPVVLGNLSEGSFSSAYFISSVGDIVGEAQNADGQAQAVVWVLSTGGGYEAPSSLNPVANNQIRSAAFGIDFNGSIVGEAELESGELQGVIWNTNGSVDSTLGENTSAQAINDVDRVVGYTAALSDSDRATIWNAASIADFRNLASIFSQAYALNDNNEIVGMVGNQAFAAIPVSQ